MIPQSAIGRIEILKDGAAATYGSDAIAGVVNFITRSEQEGFQATGDYRYVRGSSGDYTGALTAYDKALMETSDLSQRLEQQKAEKAAKK